jgi:hypothetical protein
MCRDAGSNPLTKPSSLIILVALGLLTLVFGRKHDDKEEVVKTQPMDASLKKWIGHWTQDTDVPDLGTALDLYEEDGMLAGYETYTYIAPEVPLVLHDPPKYLTNIKKVDEDTITYDIVGMKENGWTCPMRKIVWAQECKYSPTSKSVEQDTPSPKYHVFKKDGSLRGNGIRMTKK